MPEDSVSLRVLLLNGDVRGVASFWRCWHLARELGRLGHEVTLVTVSPSQRIVPRVEVADGVRLIESPNLLDLVHGLGAGYGVLGIPYRMLIAARERFDVVHAFESRPNVLLPAKLSHAFKNCPLVVDWADWWGITGDGSGNQEGRRWPVPLLETVAEEFLHREADEVTTISTGLKDRALSLGIPADRVWWIPSGAPTDTIQPMDMLLCRQELGISPSTYLIGYLGTSTGDLDMVVPTIMALRKDHPQVKIGIISPNLFRPLPLASENAVVSFGAVPFSRLPQHLGACNAFILPLRDTVFNRTCWPNKFGDYLAAGRPILCGNVGDVARFVEAEGCGMVWTAPSELVQGIESLMADERSAESVGHAARRLGEGRLSWQRLALEFLNVYWKATGHA